MQWLCVVSVISGAIRCVQVKLGLSERLADWHTCVTDGIQIPFKPDYAVEFTLMPLPDLLKDLSEMWFNICRLLKESFIECTFYKSFSAKTIFYIVIYICV